MANYQSTHTGAEIDAGIDKANKALVKTDSAPAATSLVAVDNSNAQTMLSIGDGLSVENGALKATGGSGGSGGIGGGFTVTTNTNFGKGSILILGTYYDVFGWHKLTIENNISAPTILNAVMLCVLSLDEGATSIQSDHLLYDFSGTLNEYSNLTPNKMYYITQDTNLTVSD